MKQKINKDAWVRLACSSEEVNRKLALELAYGIKDEIQEELYMWFRTTPTFNAQQELYSLLNEDYRKKAVEEGGSKIPLSFIRSKEILIYYQSTDDPIAQKVILELSAEGYSAQNGPLPFIIRYREYSKCTLGHAKMLAGDIHVAAMKLKQKLESDERKDQ